ncbi:MAG: alpha/beta hydrolase [Gammaproteobacteria bacterium]|jgi:pimeloyl-ACP methyl ester carboxylesterase
MPHFQIQELDAHYTETGRGEPLVLLHAGGTSAAHWRKMTPLLQNRFRVVAPDLIGFGETSSWHGARDLTHDDQADLVRDLLNGAIGCPVHLVGHSYGGAVAVRFGLRFPKMVKSMVLIEPVLSPLLPQVGEHALFEAERKLATAFIEDAEAGRSVSAWRRFIDHHNGDGTWESLSGNARYRFLGMTRETADAYRSNLNNATTLDDLHDLDVPTMVVCGARTSETYRRICAVLRAHLPRCIALTLDDAPHMSPLTHPSQVADAIMRHVDAVYPSARPERRDAA